MFNPWDSMSPEAQSELQGYVSAAGHSGSEFKDALLSNASHAYADIGNQYQQFLSGRTAPHTSVGGTMETTTTTSEPVGQPESMQSALLKHAAAEGAEREAEHWRGYAEPSESEPRQHSIVYPHQVGQEDGLRAHSAQDSGASSYGVGAPTHEAGAAPHAGQAGASTPAQEPDAYEPDL